ncbi:DUF1741 domain containing protein [Euroglyphus maynei]|uniref:DUF1741 domain containing protein n=1 Tax=Euroglyphus maynei TaxID=6958 RepID=A0A1Y3BLK0_EURMA|nr:DUF1741 domain containing protein [Euroglyphus maynei]
MKLELYSQQNKIVTLSEQQVFDVVRNNYDTLTLKLVENIDSYEPYNFAKCNEIEFFNRILQSVIEDLTAMKPFTINFEEQHNLIQEIQFLFPIATNTSCSAENEEAIQPSDNTDTTFSEPTLSTS